MAYKLNVIPFMVAMATSGVLSTEYLWINDNDVKVINRTDSSVVLTWQLPKKLNRSSVRNYRLFVSYNRLGYSKKVIEAHYSDPECSLLLSYCHLSNLIPGEAYTADIVIDYEHNHTVLGRADDLPFATLSPNEDDDMVWWILFAAVPIAVLILLVLTILCCARCFRCWCWRKKKLSSKKTSKSPKKTEMKTEYSKESSSSSSLDREHSLQTREWLKNTMVNITLDPESAAYDQPQVYDIPGGLNPSPPAQATCSKGQSHYYMEVIDGPPNPLELESSRNRSRSASTEPSANRKGKKLKKSRTNPNLQTSSVHLTGLECSEEAHAPPKPCKMKPKKNMIHKSASLPSRQMQIQQQLKAAQETTSSSQMSELLQKFKTKIQQQQGQQQQPQNEQTILETHHYANTDDLNKLKGNARKMFPML